MSSNYTSSAPTLSLGPGNIYAFQRYSTIQNLPSFSETSCYYIRTRDNITPQSGIVNWVYIYISFSLIIWKMFDIFYVIRAISYTLVLRCNIKGFGLGDSLSADVDIDLGLVDRIVNN